MGGTVAGSSVLADKRGGSDDESAVGDRVRDEPGVRPSVNQVLAVDANTNTRFENRTQLERDPAGDDRGEVVRMTSLDEPTTDYIVSLVDLREYDLDLGAVRKPGTLTYDFLRGPESESAAPDEVYLLLRVDDEFHVAARSKSADGAVGTWHTRDVSDELTRAGWRTIGISADAFDGDAERVRVSTDVILQRARPLVQQDPIANLPQHVGPDAELLGLGIGNGNITTPVVTDAYYDNVRIDDATAYVPAMRYMDPVFERTDGTVTATLSPANPMEKKGTEPLDQLDPDSVRLSRYSPIGPPIAGTEVADESIPATTVTVEDTAAVAHFDAEAVANVLGSAPIGTAMVSGTFDAERPTTFLAVGNR